MKGLALSTLAFALLCCGGCGDDTAPIDLVFELAPSSADTTACSVAPAVEPAVLPDTVDHLWLGICGYTGTGCEDARLVAPDGDHGAAAAGGQLVPLGSGRSFELDADLRGGPFRVEAAVCEGGRQIARGVADRVTFGKPVRVRMYRFDSVSCAGPRRAGDGVELAAPRALHAAIALPNGDVLLFGGVTGSADPSPGPGAAGLTSWQGAAIQPIVEVYDASHERIVRLDETFARVLFAAALLPPAPENESEGPYVVRVVGGFTAPQFAVRFDASQGRTYLNAPLLPTVDATAEPDADLVYHPDTLRLEVRMASSAGNPLAGANAMVTPEPGAPGAVVLGLAGGFEEDPVANWPPGGVANQPRVQDDYWFLTHEGGEAADPQNLAAPRFGHTVTRVAGAGSGAALVWGGNVHEVDPAEVQATAGELLRTSPPSVPVEGGGVSTLPHPSALHTATALGPETVLLAGGLRVGCAGPTCTGRGFSLDYTEPTLAVLAWQGSGFLPAPVDNAHFTPAILHTATSIGAGERRPAVLVGGAVVSGTSRLRPSDQIVWVGNTDVGRYGTRQLGNIPVDGLIHPRWGHAVAPLPGDRLLVTGGLRFGEDGKIEAMAEAEVVSYGPPPAADPCAGVVDGGAGGFDAGAFDAGAPVDSGSPPSDAAGDAGGGDAGVATDAGF